MDMYIKKEDILAKLEDESISIDADTKVRGVRVASEIRAESEDKLYFKMGSNEYTVANNEFNRVLYSILGRCSKIMELDGITSKEYVKVSSI